MSNHGTNCKGINSTFLVRSTKKHEAPRDDFRPINLVTSVYKKIAKVLASRLREVIGEVVRQASSAFMLGKQIRDGILLVNECLED